MSRSACNWYLPVMDLTFVPGTSNVCLEKTLSSELLFIILVLAVVELWRYRYRCLAVDRMFAGQHSNYNGNIHYSHRYGSWGEFAHHHNEEDNLLHRNNHTFSTSIFISYPKSFPKSIACGTRIMSVGGLFSVLCQADDSSTNSMVRCDQCWSLHKGRPSFLSTRHAFDSTSFQLGRAVFWFVDW